MNGDVRQEMNGVAGDPNWILSTPNASISRMSRSMKRMAPLPPDMNPYQPLDDDDLPNGNVQDEYDELAQDKYDDVVHKGQAAPQSEESELPDEKDILRQFANYLEIASPLTEEEERRLEGLPVADKWKLVANSKLHRQIASPEEYIGHLNRHVTTARRIKLSKKNQVKASSSPLLQLLANLKNDLAQDNSSFSATFVTLGGIALLIDLLGELQRQSYGKTSLKRAARDDRRRIQGEEYNCLMCIKLASSGEVGSTRLSQCHDGANTVASCILSDYIRTRTVAIQIMTSLLDAPGGYYRVLDAFTKLRVQLGENVRFGLVVSMLNSRNNVPLRFQSVCLRFFNKLLQNCKPGNPRVYLQQEMEEAGFDVESLDRYTLGFGPEYDDFQQEVETWQHNYINVVNWQNEKLGLESRCNMLRQEIDLLQAKIKEFETEKKGQETTHEQLHEKSRQYRERAAGLQDAIHKIARLYNEETTRELADDLFLDDVLGPLDLPATILSPEDRFATVRGHRPGTSAQSDTTSVISSERPPAPPLPPPPFLSHTVRKKVFTSRVSLPMLNWNQLNTVSNTVFSEVDDDALFRSLEAEFRLFEERFKLRVKQESEESKQRRQKALNRAANKILFVDPTRARNLIITKRRTNLSSREVGEAIERCETETLPGEYAQLLLKYVPTNEELRALAANLESYSKMGEAEQFMYHMAKVERLQTRLSVMAFMDIFEGLLLTVQPIIEDIYTVSESVVRCHKLQKILAIILTFGNFMNGSKRGYALGFKMDSLILLKDVRSTDKSETLIHFIVEVIQHRSPDLLDFEDELKFDLPKGASYQALAQDIEDMRAGINLVQVEKERQLDNDHLQTFYAQAAEEIAVVAENFRKMEASYKTVCSYLGENYKDTEPWELFQSLSQFADLWKEAKEVVKQRGPHPAFTRASENGDTEQIPAYYDDASLRTDRPLSFTVEDQYSEYSSIIPRSTSVKRNQSSKKYKAPDPPSSRPPKLPALNGPAVYDDIVSDAPQTRSNAVPSGIYESLPEEEEKPEKRGKKRVMLQHPSKAVIRRSSSRKYQHNEPIYQDIPAYAESATEAAEYLTPQNRDSDPLRSPGANSDSVRIHEALSHLNQVVADYSDPPPSGESVSSWL